jgi:hypothetical protein
MISLKPEFAGVVLRRTLNAAKFTLFIETPARSFTLNHGVSALNSGSVN